MLWSTFQVALLQLCGRLAGKRAHHSAEGLFQSYKVLTSKRRVIALWKPFGEHTTSATFINLPYLQNHLYRGQHLHESLPSPHHEEVAEQGAGARVWLGQKVLKLMK